MEKRDKQGRFIKGVRNSPSTEFKKGQHWRPQKPHWNSEWLIREYLIKQKSAVEIAKQEGCTENNILFWLKKYGIKTRSMSEVRRIKHWGNSGDDNPMWNKKGELAPNWKGGATPERQAFYNSPEWRSACSKVWRRDNARCQRCGINANAGTPLHIHHLLTFADKIKRANPDNLTLLCAVCHHWVHSRKNTEGRWLHAT